MTMNSICRTGAFAGLMLVTLVGLGMKSAQAADNEVLRFGAYGGSLLEAQKSYLGKPFEALTGAKIKWTAATGEIFMTKLTVAAGKNPPFDVVLLDEPWYSLLRVRGFIEELDPARVPNLKNVKKEFLLPDNAGVCLFSFTSGVVYNTKKFKELGIPPLTRYQDLANPKLSRRVGTQKITATAPKHMLAAYAIQFGDPPTKWDRALDEVAKIKFHSFDAGASGIMAKMEAGEVFAAPIVNGRAYSMIAKGLPMAFVMPDNGDGTKGGVSCTAIVIPKGSPNRALAEKLISFALSPGVQLMQAVAKTPYGPVISGLDDTLKKAPKLSARVPFGDLTKTALHLSWDKAGLEKFTQYVEKWNREVQK